MYQRSTGLIPAAAAVLALAGCGSNSSPPSSGPSGGGTPSGPQVLKLGDTSAGSVLVDSAGHAVYVYDRDTSGESTSACTGTCASLWPPVPATGHPKLGPGVKGTLGTIRAADGSSQLTLDGHPLYTYTQDEDSEDAYGQGYDGIWWLVGADGNKITSKASASASPTSPSSSSSSSGGGGYGY